MHAIAARDLDGPLPCRRDLLLAETVVMCISFSALQEVRSGPPARRLLLLCVGLPRGLKKDTETRGRAACKGEPPTKLVVEHSSREKRNFFFRNSEIPKGIDFFSRTSPEQASERFLLAKRKEIRKQATPFCAVSFLMYSAYDYLTRLS